jgi:hypothetical protein
MDTKIIGIDPGNQESGWVLVEEKKITSSGVSPNEQLLEMLREHPFATLAVEWIQSMGMTVGKEVFETCRWVGRFEQVGRENQMEVRLIPRGRIKLHHCGSSRAKDANVSQSLRDAYGQKGTKKNPGYFYGVSSHAWQAFAVAAYVLEGARHESEIS